MGTRADFYLGRGDGTEWIGSIGWDGHPTAMPKAFLKTKTIKAYRQSFDWWTAMREDFTPPSLGWPWPWSSSALTDYAYAFDGGKVYVSFFGCDWFDPLVEGKPQQFFGAADFPDMSAIKQVSFGPRSGMIVSHHVANGRGE